MKKLIISVFMVTSLCLVTVGFVRTVAAQVPSIEKVVSAGPDVDNDSAIDIVVETNQTGTTEYEFEITYDNDGDTTDVIIKDTIPAEWNVTMINGEAIEPLGKGQPIASGDDGTNGTYTAARSGKDPKGEGPKSPKASPKKNNSSTQICWIPPTDSGTYILTVTVQTRRSPSGKLKYAPTSCGLLVLNPGATAYAYDPDTGEIVLDDEGLPVVLAETTSPLELVAVEDLNGDEVVDPTGVGDEDGDTLSDKEEVFDYGTSPCSDDTDSDGALDGVDNCPTTANFDQLDYDNDGMGDACDPDDDNDGVLDESDQCQGFDDNVDTDGDGVADGCDACPGFDDTADADGDGTPDGCDPDDDNDDTVQ